MDSQHFIVNRDDLSQHEAVAMPRESLAPDTIELRIDRFGLTFLNLAYARLGESLEFWKFFPVSRPGWGRIPTWGFGTVVRSRVRAVSIGERYYGCFPMSSHLVVRPDNFHPLGFYDATPHRLELSQVYNNFVRTTLDPGYRADSEFQQVVLRRVFWTSFYLADYLDEHALFDADTAIVSCASSKMALGMAFVLAQARKRASCELVALTAARNVEFVARLGLYNRVVAYDNVTALPVVGRALLVDIAGGTEVRGAVHRHFGPALTHVLTAGSTHGPRQSPGEEFARTKLLDFFAPAWMEQRVAQWTRAGAQQRLADAWNAFLVPLQDLSRHWMTIASCIGPDAVARTYDEILDNRARPDLGYVLSL